jgi:proteasome accessory factor B
MAPREPKLQRWTDLVAALLRRRYPATFEEIARDVPAYSDGTKKRDALMRMFERDKDELRAFGISIDMIQFQDDDGDASGYRLDRKTFYLPYLSLAARGGKPASHPRRPDKYGYRALASLVFEPDELEILSHAAQRVRALDDPVLSEESGSAMRKLSFDLPVPPVEQPFVASSGGPEDVFVVLNDALKRRKRVSFDYHAMSTGETTKRAVDPYGLFFLSAHWYLAGHDADRNELRNFRLSRISSVMVNHLRAQTSDYDIPDSFSLRDHARSRRPWDLGEGDVNEALVDFTGSSGAAKAAARLGVAVEGAQERRKFRFRRLDSFARWLLSFGGEAIPVSPEPLVLEFKRQVVATRAVYGGET